MPRNKNRLYKSFTATPHTIYREDKNPRTKEIILTMVDRNATLGLIAEDVEFITDHVSSTIEQWGTQILDHYHHYQFEKEQQWRLERIEKGKDTDTSSFNFNIPSNTVARELGYIIASDDYDSYLGGSKTGRSRYDMLYQNRLFNEITSWDERVQASHKTTEKYVSSGWARTVRTFAPQNIAPKVSLSAVDSQFAKFLSNPLENENFIMRMVIKGQNYQLHFSYKKDRFFDATKVCLPDITLDEKGISRFHFAVEYKYNYGDISSRYIVGVDVGITTYATVVVWDTVDECIVHASDLSRNIHSLYNSVRASDRQKLALISQGRYEEAALHRSANISKKRELAIASALEIVDIAYAWGNAVIVIEDLSWIKNTMQNGLWNRGELAKWIDHYAKLNGSRMFRVNAAGSSQQCHVCEGRVSHTQWKDSVCPVHGIMDRDVNAAAVIAKRFVPKLERVIASRKKAKSYTPGKPARRSAAPKSSRKYPGCKNNVKKKKYKSPSKRYHCLPSRTQVKSALGRKCKEEVNSVLCSLYHSDDGTVCGDSTQYGSRTLEKQHDFSYDRLLLKSSLL